MYTLLYVALLLFLSLESPSLVGVCLCLRDILEKGYYIVVKLRENVLKPLLYLLSELPASQGPPDWLNPLLRVSRCQKSTQSPPLRGWMDYKSMLELLQSSWNNLPRADMNSPPK